MDVAVSELWFGVCYGGVHVLVNSGSRGGELQTERNGSNGGTGVALLADRRGPQEVQGVSGGSIPHVVDGDPHNRGPGERNRIPNGTTSVLHCVSRHALAEGPPGFHSDP